MYIFLFHLFPRTKKKFSRTSHCNTKNQKINMDELHHLFFASESRITCHECKMYYNVLFLIQVKYVKNRRRELLYSRVELSVEYNALQAVFMISSFPPSSSFLLLFFPPRFYLRLGGPPRVVELPVLPAAPPFLGADDFLPGRGSLHPSFRSILPIICGLGTAFPDSYSAMT